MSTIPIAKLDDVSGGKAAQPYTIADLELGRKLVRQLHGVGSGFDAWAEHLAKAIVAERTASSERIRVLEQQLAECEADLGKIYGLDIEVDTVSAAPRPVPVPALSLAGDDWKHYPSTEALLESWQTDNQTIILMGDGRYDCRVKSEQRWWKQIGEADTLDAAKQCFDHDPVPAPGVTVTDEMVERARTAAMRCSDLAYSPNTMRAALSAALRPKE